MNQIQKILKTGKTKYRIAKDLNVAWQTVHMWDKGVFKPSKEHQIALEAMLTK